MTIAIDLRPALQGWGGVEAYTRHCVSTLIEQHPDHTFLLFWNQYKRTSIQWLDAHPNAIPVVAHIPNKVFQASLLTGVIRIDELIEKISGHHSDVFFAPNLDFFSFSKHIPFVVTLHDLSFEVYPEFFSWKSRIWHSAVRPQKWIRRASHIITVSQSTKRDASARYGISSEKISAIPLASPMMPTNEMLCRENFILALYPNDRRKNAPYVIESFGRACKKNDALRSHRLVFAGPVSRTREAYLVRIARDYGIADSIRFVGFVSQKEMQRLFASAQIFFYPSFYEGFGLPMLEAAACLTPVIAAADSSIGEVMGDTVLLVDPYDVNAGSLALQALLEDRELAHTYADRALVRAHRYTWEKTAHQTMDVLMRAVKA
jgi:glycosyltransferase involved in cell wall biosynthesis